MRQQGVLSDWNDDRGFGFITPAGGGDRVFVHVSEFPRGRRPTSHDVVTYALARDARNRVRASQVEYVAPRLATRPDVRSPLAIASLFFALLAGLVALGRVPALVMAPYALLSVVAFAMYRADKTAAERGAWRVPEANLHAVALLGGWPGALVARRVFRHKTKKQPFRTIFWGTVIANCLALAWVFYDMPLTLG
jgi:uncharacterized membrane protein YsdA (DUF1294 family)/cold shock CspA family protein